jgi:hypothetical protein
MALPDNCELIDGHLVFWELAHPSTLSNEQGLYEYVCFNACTNALKPMGPHKVAQFALPELGEGEAVSWGGRMLTATEVSTYRAEGMVLAAVQLPVEPMGGPGSLVS